jgi:hypothetical protein
VVARKTVSNLLRIGLSITFPHPSLRNDSVSTLQFTLRKKKIVAGLNGNPTAKRYDLEQKIACSFKKLNM